MATYKVKSKGTEHTVNVIDKATGGATITIEGCDETFEVEFVGGTGAEIAAASAAVAGGPPSSVAVTPQPAAVSASPVAAAPVARAAAPPTRAAVGEGAVVAPIPGKILSIDVAVGDAVEINQVLLKLEAMKMENNVASPTAGTVQSIDVAVGAEVSDGQVLIVIG